MGKRLEQSFFQRRYANGQQMYEKMFNITDHWGNANQTTIKYHLTPIFKVKTKLTRMWRNQNPYMIGK